MLESIIFLVVGIFILIKGADWLVEGSSSLAQKWGVPSLIIGLTVVAFGTSMPELVVSLVAVTGGQTGTAFGNIIGSNLSNLLLVLAVAALIKPPKLSSQTVWKEIPFSLLAAVVLLVISNDFIIDKINISSLTRVDGMVLLLFFIIFIYYVIESARHSRTEDGKSLEIEKMDSWKSWMLIVGGVVGLFLGGKWVVENAVSIAEMLGVSDFLVAATVVAIGTSLPELVTSIKAAMKDDLDLIVGNIVGSNIFNIFWILGITSVVAPIEIPRAINFDIAFLAAVTLLLFFFVFTTRKRTLERREAAVFITLYAAYIIFIVIRG